MAMLPLKTQYKGPAAKETRDTDIIEEAIYYFKANVFSRTTKSRMKQTEL
uniref:Uncharacterized protein n=1 Tax=Anguilla anguilla TaxID=7936 RepID=A0A0E9VKZ7_ANGAN